MGSLTDYSENELMDHVFNAAYTPAATVYLALFTAAPGEAGGGTEANYTNYARTAITFGAAASRRVTQSGAVVFPQSGGGSNTVTHWAIFDASTSGNMLAYGSLATSKSIVTGNTPTVPTTSVYVDIATGGVSNYLAHAWLNLMFRNTAFSKPDTYAALTTATIADTDTGSTITEPSGNGYARKQVNINGGASPTWDLAASGLVDNTHAITFATATGSWGTIVATCIVDAAAAGNMLFYDNSVTDQLVGVDDVVEFPIGDFDASLS